MIRVAANLAWLVPGGVGGSEEYTVRLLRGVGALAPSDIAVEVHGSTALLRAHPGLDELGFRSLGGPFRSRAHRLLVESTRLVGATRGADVVHHFGGRVPARRHGNDVVTIHDLQPLDLPQNFSRLKSAYLRSALPRSAAAARYICTPSQWVADRVVGQLGADAARMRVVSSAWGPVDGADVDQALLESLVDRRVVVYPAVTHPHKNHAVLLAAVDRLADRHPDLVLVLTGGTGRAEADVQTASARARVEVVRPGRVSGSTVAALIERADLLAFPSGYEGFGLPVIEAMHAGTPVVAADAAALPEVVGGAGLLVDPGDELAWADAITAVLDGGELRERLVAAGHEQAAKYAPPVAARRLLDVWREAA